MEEFDDDYLMCVPDADALRRLEEYKQRRRAEKKAEREAAQMAQQNQAQGKTSTRLDYPTPNGGVYSIAYWQDADGNPTTPDKAVVAEVHEMDERDQSIFRTYVSLER